jgi:hypothetical protein
MNWRTCSFVFLLIVCVATVSAEAPPILWQNWYGENEVDDYFYGPGVAQSDNSMVFNEGGETGCSGSHQMVQTVVPRQR